MEEKLSSETPIFTGPTQRHISDDDILYNYLHENHKSCTLPYIAFMDI
jgi:hypothetical protein